MNCVIHIQRYKQENEVKDRDVTKAITVSDPIGPGTDEMARGLLD
jgi:hypothetical protein